MEELRRCSKLKVKSFRRLLSVLSKHIESQKITKIKSKEFEMTFKLLPGTSLNKAAAGAPSC